MPRKFTLICGIIAFLGRMTLASEASAVRLPFRGEDRGGWSFEASGLFEGWADRRELFVLHHPWAASESNRCGTVWQEVHIPTNWPGRARLWFYMSDDYFGDGPTLTNGWLGQIKLVGHRFKQVLADDEVIWERDVADPTGPGETCEVSVLLPERIRAGTNVRLAFRLIDKVASSQRLPEDHRYIGATDGIKPTDEWKFKTDVFLGDVRLAPDGTEAPAVEERPTVRAVRAVHRQRWPLKPEGGPIRYPEALSWEHHDDLDGREWPIHCGVPLAAGRVGDAGGVVLRDQLGRRLPLQAKAMNTWPDGSVRWVELDALAPADTNTGKLLLDVRPPGGRDNGEDKGGDQGATVAAMGKELILKGGAVEVVLPTEAGCLVRSIRNGTALLEQLEGKVEVNGKVCRPVIETTQVLAQGPVRAEAELRGLLKGEGAVMGRFVFRLAVFAGQPLVRLTWRVFNDRAERLHVSRLELLAHSNLSDGIVRWDASGKVAPGGACLRQAGENKFEVSDPLDKVIERGPASAGWLAGSDTHQTLQVLVRHFRQQYPKALELRMGGSHAEAVAGGVPLAPARLRVALFEATADQPFYEPAEGEAKRHEIWLGLWDRVMGPAELERSARYFTRPARLFDAACFCASGGFGYAAPHSTNQCAEFDAIVKQLYGDIAPALFYTNGFRNWGDNPYGAPPQWCNGYYDAQQGLASEYLMSGRPIWFDHLEATVRHIIDVDVCHASASHPDWIGSIHDAHSGPDHAGAGPWCTTQRTRGTLAYWRLSGDLDARETALAVADSAVRTKRGIGSTSVRDHAGILYCLTAAYDETHDLKYLQAARELVHDALSRIDGRRGCYAEVHGNVSYQGNIPWLCAQLAEPLYYYYRQSGEVNAAIAVAGLAESILTEECDRTVPGDVYGYTFNPHNWYKNTNYHVLIAPTVFYAYELTGDEFYLIQGRAMWAKMLQARDVNYVRNCYWLAPTLLYYVTALGK